MNVMLRDQPAVARPDTLRRWFLLVVAGGMGFVLLTVVVLTTGGTDPLDLTIMHAMNALRTPLGMSIGKVVTWFGSYQGVVVIALVVIALITVRTRRLLEPVVMGLTIAISSGLVYLVKIAVGRARPPSARSLGETVSDYSFPSGHTTTGSVLFVLATVLFASTVESPWTRRVLVSIGLISAAAIGWSRVYLGYHWATDVLGGWCLMAALVGMAMLPAATLRSAHSAEPALEGALVCPRTPEPPLTLTETASNDPSQLGRPGGADLRTEQHLTSQSRPRADATESACHATQNRSSATSGAGGASREARRCGSEK